MNLIVDCGAVPALVMHLMAPPPLRGESTPKQYEHEVEKESAFALGLIAVKVIGQETDYSFLIFHCSLHNLFS